MSRAFVDEDASASNEAEAPEIKIPIPPGSRNYLTSEGAEALSSELHELTAVERPGLLSELAARAGASASAAQAPDQDVIGALRRRLGELDRRIAYLYAMSSLAEVQLPPPPELRDRVKFGATVRVREPGGSEEEYRIVGVDEADPERGLIGWPSPVARSRMGTRAGDTATVKLPGGQRSLAVLAVEYR
jgi:transcription elongation factor GreB